MNTKITVRVWDLPTRLFHWLLAICVVALVVTAKIGGDAMDWHFRLGYTTGALLVFRVIWGLCGGYWSRFVHFIYSPRSILAYCRNQAPLEHKVGHNPIGSFSVFGLLGILCLQVGTGLFTNDEIAYAGPLTSFVSDDLVSTLTTYHKTWGQWIILSLVGLHILAIVLYAVIKREKLVPPMIHGDKHVPQAVPASRDTAGTRMLALVIFATIAALTFWLVSLA